MAGPGILWEMRISALATLDERWYQKGFEERASNMLYFARQSGSMDSAKVDPRIQTPLRRMNSPAI